MVLLITTASMSAQENKIKLPFQEIDFSIGREYTGRLIDSYEKALEIGLGKENEKEFYKNNAVYLFNVGGGCFGAIPSEIFIVLKNNFVNINWNEPIEDCPKVGEATPFYGMIVIQKREYPNYKKFKFKYYWE